MKKSKEIKGEQVIQQDVNQYVQVDILNDAEVIPIYTTAKILGTPKATACKKALKSSYESLHFSYCLLTVRATKHQIACDHRSVYVNVSDYCLLKLHV